jgi:hypothetical protein
MSNKTSLLASDQPDRRVLGDEEDVMDNQLSCGHGSMVTGSRVVDDDTVGVIALPSDL